MLKTRFATAFIVLLATGLTMPQWGIAQDKPGVEAATTALTNLIKLNNQSKLLSAPALALVTGEAKSWQTATLGTLNATPDKTLQIDSNHVVGRVQWQDKNKHTTDYYFFVSQNNEHHWLVESCRSLASIGMVAEAQKRLAAKQSKNTDEKYQLRNMALLMSSDAQLHKWFDKHKSTLDALSAAARAIPKPYPGEIKASNKKYPAIAKMILDLDLDSVAVHDPHEMQVIIGGVNRDFVGLLNAPGGKHPVISDRNWIWVEDLGGNWFLFKHT